MTDDRGHCHGDHAKRYNHRHCEDLPPPPRRGCVRGLRVRGRVRVRGGLRDISFRSLREFQEFTPAIHTWSLTFLDVRDPTFAFAQTASVSDALRSPPRSYRARWYNRAASFLHGQFRFTVQCDSPPTLLLPSTPAARVDAPTRPRACQPSRRRGGVVLLVSGALALTLAACGSSTTRDPAGNLAFTVPATSAPPGVTAVQPPQPAANDAALPRCTPAELTLTLSRVTDTIGQVDFTLHVTNSGQIDCFLEGYATTGAGTGRWRETRTETASDVLQVPPPAAVVLRPALSATAISSMTETTETTETSVVRGTPCARWIWASQRDTSDGSRSTARTGSAREPFSGQLGMAAWDPSSIPT